MDGGHRVLVRFTKSSNSGGGVLGIQICMEGGVNLDPKPSVLSPKPFTGLFRTSMLQALTLGLLTCFRSLEVYDASCI